MRLVAILAVIFFSGLASASECYPVFNEKDFISAIGKKPENMQVFNDGGTLRHQYSFRKESIGEEAFNDESKGDDEPQFYITVYDPPCPERITIHFYANEDKSMNQINVALAGKAFEYLVGTSSTIFFNKIEKLKGVQRFDSYDEKADSVFAKIGDSYSIQIHIK